MPRTINKTIGNCDCRRKGCAERADIRRKKDHENGDRYLVCPTHGRDMAYGPSEQAALDAWIDDHALSDEPSPGPEPDPAPDPAQGKEGAGEGKPTENEETPAKTPAGPAPDPEKGEGFIVEGDREFEEFFNS